MITHIAGETFILFHKSLIFLIDFKYFTDAISSCFGLKKQKKSLGLFLGMKQQREASEKEGRKNHNKESKINKPFARH